jgi:hypothetical protein
MTTAETRTALRQPFCGTRPAGGDPDALVDVSIAGGQRAQHGEQQG